MTRAAICGGPELLAVGAALGLVGSVDPEIVIVDLRSSDAVTRAAAYAASIPRVVVAEGATAAMLRAAGTPHVATGIAAEVLGPLVSAALPRRAALATRIVIVTAARGGVGRTLLATNVARRVARRRSLWLVDATGTGAAAWWMREEARPWPELEPLTHELSVEHLRIVAAGPASGVSVLGGGGRAPSARLLEATLHALRDELVILDAPLLATEVTSVSAGEAHPACRTLVVSYGDPASLAALEPYDLGPAWLIASQGPLAGRPAFRMLPRDDDAVGSALARRSAVGGRLGRAYDELAEVIAIDAT